MFLEVDFGKFRNTPVFPFSCRLNIEFSTDSDLTADYKRDIMNNNETVKY